MIIEPIIQKNSAKIFEILIFNLKSLEENTGFKKKNTDKMDNEDGSDDDYDEFDEKDEEDELDNKMIDQEVLFFIFSL